MQRVQAARRRRGADRGRDRHLDGQGRRHHQGQRRRRRDRDRQVAGRAAVAVRRHRDRAARRRRARPIPVGTPIIAVDDGTDRCVGAARRDRAGEHRPAPAELDLSNPAAGARERDARRLRPASPGSALRRARRGPATARPTPGRRPSCRCRGRSRSARRDTSEVVPADEDAGARASPRHGRRRRRAGAWSVGTVLRQAAGPQARPRARRRPRVGHPVRVRAAWSPPRTSRRRPAAGSAGRPARPVQPVAASGAVRRSPLKAWRPWPS